MRAFSRAARPVESVVDFIKLDSSTGEDKAKHNLCRQPFANLWISMDACGKAPSFVNFTIAGRASEKNLRGYEEMFVCDFNGLARLRVRWHRVWAPNCEISQMA